MGDDSIEILIYQTADAKEPIIEWINSLKDKKGRLILLMRIQRLRNGNFGDCKALSGKKNVHEIRIPFGPGYRIYFVPMSGNCVMLPARVCPCSAGNSLSL